MALFHAPTPHSDFVLYPQARRSFEAPPSARSTPNPADADTLSGSYRRHSSHLASAPALQNQRVAEIIQGTGHSTTSAAFTNNRYTSAQNHFYASSAPSSSVALQSQQSRVRPPVPTFTQSAPNIHTKQNFRTAPMAQDMDLFGDYTFEVGPTTGGSYQAGFGSPAIPTSYDLEMVRTSSSSTNVGTVSPQDLVVRDPSFSAPNSTAFTNLTSPSIYNVSPDFQDGYEASPMFGTNDLDPALSEPWFSLFPEDQSVTQPVDHSPLEPGEELVVSEHLRTSQHRRSGSSPGSGSIKASSTSGVAARKRNQPLPPIVVDDPADTIAVKRARNTLAARKSRAKKMEKFEELEQEIANLKADRDHWKSLALGRAAAQE